MPPPTDVNDIPDQDNLIADELAKMQAEQLKEFLASSSTTAPRLGETPQGVESDNTEVGVAEALSEMSDSGQLPEAPRVVASQASTHHGRTQPSSVLVRPGYTPGESVSTEDSEGVGADDILDDVIAATEKRKTDQQLTISAEKEDDTASDLVESPEGLGDSAESHEPTDDTPDAKDLLDDIKAAVDAKPANTVGTPKNEDLGGEITQPEKLTKTTAGTAEVGNAVESDLPSSDDAEDIGQNQVEVSGEDSATRETSPTEPQEQPSTDAENSEDAETPAQPKDLSDNPTRPEPIHEDSTEQVAQQEEEQESKKQREQAAKEWLKEHITTEEVEEERYDGSTETREVVKLNFKWLEKVPKEIASEVALQLLTNPEKSSQYQRLFINNIKKFKSLDESVVNEILNSNDPTLSTRVPLVRLLIKQTKRFSGLKLDADLAVRIIEADCGYQLIRHIKSFKGVKLDGEVADKLVDHGQLSTLLTELDKFSDVTVDNEFIRAAMRAHPDNVSSVVTSRIPKTETKRKRTSPAEIIRAAGIEHDDELARLAIDSGCSRQVAERIDEFSALSTDTMVRLGVEYPREVLRQLDKLPDLDPQIVVDIIDQRRQQADPNSSVYLEGINTMSKAVQSAVAISEINNGDIDKVINYRVFRELDHSVMEALIEQGDFYPLFSRPELFDDFVLDLSLAQKMIELDRVRYLGEVLANLTDAERASLVEPICNQAPDFIVELSEIIGEIDVSDESKTKINSLARYAQRCERIGEYIDAYIADFPEADKDRLVLGSFYVMSKLRGDSHSLGRSLAGLHVLKPETATRLIEIGDGSTVLENMDAFRDLSADENLANVFLSLGKANSLSEYLHLFSGLSNQVAYDLIEAGPASAVLRNPQVFGGLKFDNELATRVLSAEGTRSALAVAFNLASFTGLSDKVAYDLVEAGLVEQVSCYLDRFTDLSNDTATLMINAGVTGLEAVANNPDSFMDGTNNDAVRKAQLVVGQLEGLDHQLRALTLNYIDLNQDYEQLGTTTSNIIKVVKKIHYSTSSEMANFAGSIAALVLESQEPDQALIDIEQIFVKNNIPTVIKLLKVFETLNPDSRAYVSQTKGRVSPVLQHEVEEGRDPIDTIAADLIRASMGSNNRSLRFFLQEIADNEELLSGIEQPDFDWSQLSDGQRERLKAFIDRLDTIADVSERNSDTVVDEADLRARYLQLKHDLGAEDVPLADRVAKLIAYPVGFRGSLSEVLGYMDGVVQRADARGRQLAEAGEFELAEGDLVKGVASHGTISYLTRILQNGSVAKEFLGDASTSDGTPLDTDLSLVYAAGDTLESTIGRAEAGKYGDVLFVLKGRESRFLVTRDNTGTRELSEDDDFSRLELFQTAVMGADHYGIRTGFASSEVDFVIIRPSMSTRDIQKIGWEIAKNGFYIPVVSSQTGKVVFTPSDYDAMRSQLSGLTEYGIPEYDFSQSLGERITEDEVAEVKREAEKTAKHSQAIIHEISSAMSGIETKGGKLSVSDDPDEHGVTAIVADTGSTGRSTNIPGSGDFDLMIRITPAVLQDDQEMESIRQAIEQKLGGTLERTPGGDLRIKGAQVEGVDRPADVDVSFVVQTTKLEFSSEQALIERLNTIRDQDEDRYYQVLANIALAKRLLKREHVYKKRTSPEHEGGLGGIGVENWILTSGGSLLAAAQGFVAAAEGRTFDQFAEEYTVFDAGQNYFGVRDSRYEYDDFVRNMDAEGYERMKKLCQDIVAGKIRQDQQT